ncbi:MAG TPA: hypothetical protein ENF32_05240 [Thermosulfidibacter takaii]|uniref:Uncharacterized protein n=1 Tax=Thermosulfidibacter takaii TaxID=412593 RepID=A0A7C0Y743_9BACT|nr:hypothetical protein [Thermosulfidibacter takaii]
MVVEKTFFLYNFFKTCPMLGAVLQMDKNFPFEEEDHDGHLQERRWSPPSPGLPREALKK